MTESALSSPRSRLAAIIAEARRRGRRRKFALAAVGLVALLIGGGIWAGLTLSGGGGGAAAVHAPPGYHVVQAQGPVAHQILETWTFPPGVSVDLATGKGRPVRTTREIWWDSRGDASRFVDRYDGRLHADHAQSCPHTVGRSACWPGFSFKSYWPLDSSRYTRQPGIGTFRGVPVIWIAPRQPGGFPASPGEGERIGLDPRTHEPVADRTYSDGKLISQAGVLERKPDIASGNYAFVVPNPTNPLRQPPAPFSARGSDPLAPRARRALGQRPLWLGERFEGHRLETVTIGSTFTPPTGIRPTATPFVAYDYGNIAIMEFSSRGLFGAAGGPPAGRMTLEEPEESTSPNRIGGLQVAQGGVLVWANKTRPGNSVLDRAGALRIARALRPVPLPS